MKVAKSSAAIRHGVLVFLSLFLFAVLIVLIKPATTGFIVFQDTTSGNFNAGTYNNTSFNTSYVSLNASNITGLFTSRVLGAGRPSQWLNITWIEGVPYGENLPDRETVEASTVLGGANMSGNVLLLHLDESSGTTATDSSGSANTGTTSNDSWATGRLGNAHSFNGTGSFIKVNASNQNNVTSAFTIELWVNANLTNKSSQALVSKWEPGTGNLTHNVSNSWQVMEANRTLSSPNFRGYNGAVFDGRYAYFVPNADTGGAGNHGNLLRYDTYGNFTNNISNSWGTINLAQLNSNFVGYVGGVFDGKYIYFAHGNSGATSGKMLRYDTTGNFTNNATDTATGHPSWQVMDTRTLSTESGNYNGAIFDGKYIYFIPGGAFSFVYRYDTTGNFTHNTTTTATGNPSWEVMNVETLKSTFNGYQGAVFDGRYIYFTPYVGSTYNGNLLRYDTTGNFTHNTTTTVSGHPSWQVMDASTMNTNFKGYTGIGFDGHYIYYAPFYNGVGENGNFLRYDTTGNFTHNQTTTAYETPSWQVMDTRTFNGEFSGYSDGIFDGKYMYFVPHQNSLNLHGTLLRYDTTGNFTHNRTNTATRHPSWQAINVTKSLNANFGRYKGGVFDGRYVYLVPEAHIENEGAQGSGAILRYDSAASNSSYSLQYAPGGSSGNTLGGSTFGVTIKIANSTGAYVLSTNSYSLTAGWHHIAATYDSNNLTLFIDGLNKTSKGAPGLVQASSADLIIGAMTSPGANNTTSSSLNGTIDEIAIFNRSLSAAEILSHYKRGLQLNLTLATSDNNITFLDFVGPFNTTAIQFVNSSLGNTSNITNATYIQYRASFDSLNGNYSVELYNMTINYQFLPLVNTTAPANNSSVNTQSANITVLLDHPSKTSSYVEIFRNGTNISYGLVQNNTLTNRTWTNASTSDGIYTYFARAYDNSSNFVSVMTRNVTVIVDTTAPSITASAQMHINTTVANSSWVVNFTITDNIYKENDTAELNGTNYTLTKQGSFYTATITLSPGNYTVKAYANDSAQNQQTLPNNWVVFQNDAPTVTVNAPANNSTITSTIPNITITVTSEEASYYTEVFRNGTNISYGLVQNNTATNRTWTNATSSEGIYTYFARAYDNLSNAVSSGNRTIILDVTSPTITNVSISPLNVTVTNNSAHVFNFSITDNTYLENTSIELNNTANGTAINYSFTKDSTQFNFTISFSALANNNYTIIVYANDSGGNSARFANNWLNVNVPASGSGETGGGEPRGEGGSGVTGAIGTISIQNRAATIQNADREAEVEIILAGGNTYTARIIDITTASVRIKFSSINDPLTVSTTGSLYVDLNKDGINDVMVTLNKIDRGLADISFDVIAPTPMPKEITEEGGLETEEFEEGAAGLNVQIKTRVLAFLSAMALLAVVFFVRFFPEIFGLKVKERKD